MAKYNIIQDKPFEFAIKIVNLYKYLCEEKREFVMSKQILCCGTSIGANVEESIGGHSPKDFIAKLGISYREDRETIFWLKLLAATDYISKNQAEPLLNEAEKICKICAKIIITMKKKLNE